MQRLQGQLAAAGEIFFVRVQKKSVRHFLRSVSREFSEHFCGEDAFHYRVVGVPETVGDEVSVANINAG